MKYKAQVAFFVFLLSAQNTTFSASMEEAQKPQAGPSAAESFSLTYLYNPVLPLITALPPETIASISACLNDPEWVQALVRKNFPTDETTQKKLLAAYNHRSDHDKQNKAERAAEYKQRLQEIFGANKQRQQEFTQAYDCLNAFLTFSKIPDLARQLTSNTLRYINIVITRAESNPGFSNPSMLCDGKDPSLQEGILINHLRHHLRRLQRYSVYDSKNDTLNVAKLIEFMKRAESLAKIGINGIRIPYLEQNSTVLDEAEIQQWAADHGNPETINATEWLRKHEPHFEAKIRLEQQMMKICTEVNQLIEPLEQVVALVLGIVGYQPFADGNKRTAWVLAHIICAQNDLILEPLIKGSSDYHAYHKLLDDLRAKPNDNDETLNAIHNFFKQRIQTRQQPRPGQISNQSARVTVIKKRSKRFTSFPTAFFQNPTLHGGIFFSDAQLGDALAIAQMPPNQQLATMKEKYPHYWTRKEQKEALDWLAALHSCSDLLTEDNFAENVIIEILTKINAAVLNRPIIKNSQTNELRQTKHLWNWIKGGNLHWSSEKISPQELALRVYLLIPEQRKKLIGCHVYNPDTDHIATDELRKFFSVLCHVGAHRTILGGTSFSVKGEDVTFSLVNYDEIERWAAEQNLKGTFNVCDWISKRSFEFSEPKFIQWELQETLTLVRRETGGFEKAFRLLLGILDLCPYPDGNKRTARLAASIILLQHGFAPLIIDSKGAKLMNDYTVARAGSAQKRSLQFQLRSYCIKQIEEYQARVDHEIGDIAATTEPFPETEAEQVQRVHEKLISNIVAALEPEQDFEPSKTEESVKVAETDKPVKSSGRKTQRKKKKKKKKKGKR